MSHVYNSLHLRNVVCTLTLPGRWCATLPKSGLRTTAKGKQLHSVFRITKLKTGRLLFLKRDYLYFTTQKTPLSVCLPACLPACLSACLLACLSACLPACLPAILRACVPACLRACLPACLLACRPVCLPACLPAFPSCLSVTQGYGGGSRLATVFSSGSGSPPQVWLHRAMLRSFRSFSGGIIFRKITQWNGISYFFFFFFYPLTDGEK